MKKKKKKRLPYIQSWHELRQCHAGNSQQSDGNILSVNRSAFYMVQVVTPGPGQARSTSRKNISPRMNISQGIANLATGQEVNAATGIQDAQRGTEIKYSFK